MKKRFLALAIVGTMLLGSVSTALTANAIQTNYEPSKVTAQLNGSSETYGDFEYSVYDGNVTIKKYKGSASSVTIPSAINGKSVTKIGDSAFKNCTSLTSVTIPKSVTKIDLSAFYCCISLKSVEIPGSVTEISSFVFYGCTSLKNVTIPSGVTAIGRSVFSNCTSLISINVESGNTKYSSADGILFNKDKTKLITSPGGKTGTYTIPNSVTSIAESAFENCTSLSDITIPNSVTLIGDYAFRGCTSLTGITIPSSVTVIGNRAFFGCTSLKNINVNSGNTTYSSMNGVLFNKGQTKLITYPAGKTGTYTIPSSVTGIASSSFSTCTSLASITIPSSVAEIGDSAFYCCTSLASITIPSGVTSIGLSTFGDCTSLTEVTIPNSLTEIGWGAFVNCTSLSDVYYMGTEKQWKVVSIDSDNDCLTNATIHYTSTTPDTDTTYPDNCGDADGDKAITSADALFILRASVGLQDYDNNLKKILDVNCDGTVDSADSLSVLRYSVGYRDAGVYITL